MTLAQRMKELCRIYDLHPSRSKGQNFLITESVYDDIIAAAELDKKDTVLEVGPGLGFLTARLAKDAGQVITVELDDKISAFLRVALDSQAVENVTLLNQDILRFNPGDLPAAYKIVANLPYNISSIFLRTFLEQKNAPERMVLLLQKEVAERLLARPGKMNLLALSVQFYSQPEIVRLVKAGNFWPEPKVDSALVRLKLHSHRSDVYNDSEKKAFFRLARVGFSAKRKMLKNNLAAGLGIDLKLAAELLAAANLTSQVRAEDLSLDDWQKLFATARSFVL
ncbi:ribosomal RNA small subunit methyltransferase A [Candidatus Falkowbacteria bacterium]|jgi:16S rRNA (adenine1518-N6/adenine1519-N6)-dimethyltransferase|nr:16S rRNA (adenine(1518)-N(6)/adenine(1519)-N(6))-dimethyltransferase RsmA [Patescibacteria group bacterium]MDD3435002.1 16S rRNA (adenine(1518)-N(6)/adenine(1519)-N(6))-dimethyltransferase RsmA [Patescibacteria group bacterium]NCU43130.1 ribosomal RNA small subunit methyltransferase A [Candidatus Falkowbacteria bacterium]